MSLATLLLALAPAIFRPKPEPEKSDRELALEKELDRVLQLNEAAAGRIQELEAERDSWRRRFEEARDILARRIDHRLNQMPAGPDYQNAMLQAQCAQQAMNAQAAMQNAMVYGQGALLGAQALAPLEWCNCVPARHDMFLRPGDGS